MKTSQLKILLSKLDAVPDPDPELEQYPTPPDIAADVVNQAQLHQDLNGDVIDLGCGNGILALGAAVMGAEEVYGYDVDEQAIEVAEQNKKLLEEEIDRELPISFVQRDLIEVGTEADTVIMNPPFGIQREQANRVFLKKAFELAPAVYALLHQSETKKGKTRRVLAQLADQHGFDTVVLETYDFPLPRTFEFHEKERKDIKVDLYKFFRRN